MAINTINQVTLVGNLGKDPKYTEHENGSKTCHIRLASTNKWKNRETGQWEEDTDWNDGVAFNGLGKYISDKFSKGSRIAISGRLSQGQVIIENVSGV